MFGMLDYRAHKLYLLLFGIPLFVIYWSFAIGRPLFSSLVAYSHFESGFTKLAGAIGLMLLSEIVLVPISFVLAKLVNFVFKLIVDIIPADGRTAEEALFVATNGDRAIAAIILAKRPTEWDESSIEIVASADWIQNLFFGRDIRNRLHFLKRRYQELELEHGTYPVNEQAVRGLLLEGGLSPMSKAERYISNKQIRMMIYPYLIFVFIVVGDLFGFNFL